MEHSRRFAVPAALLALGWLTACAPLRVDEDIEAIGRDSLERQGHAPTWHKSDEARAGARRRASALLESPLGMEEAVGVALLQSPGVQATLAAAAANSAELTDFARVSNPVVGYGKKQGGGDAEISRSVEVMLLDLLYFPQRQRIAESGRDGVRVGAMASVASLSNEVRRAWIEAVAAGQSLDYARKVERAALASASLADGMVAAGNYSVLEEAKQKLFQADAVQVLADAQRRDSSARARLVALLGLDDAQSAQLQLPTTLPGLPGERRDRPGEAQALFDSRYDVRIAAASLEERRVALGLDRTRSVLGSLDVAAVSTSETGEATKEGFEVSLEVPLFDTGSATRAASGARYAEALSETTRVAQAARADLARAWEEYGAAWTISNHYDAQIVPLQSRVVEESLLRYNGMLIDVFELIGAAREQSLAVLASIDARRRFWAADADLTAASLGTPHLTRNER